MNRALAKFLIATVSVILILAACAYGGWTARGWRCTVELANFKTEISTKAQKQREATRLIEVQQEAATEQSSQRLDQQQVTQQKEIVYVDKQVIQYRDRWRDRTCDRPADWVYLYNTSLFGADPAMPEAGATGSAPDSASVLLPAGRH